MEGPVLGSFYNVEMQDKSWHLAEVIQKRENPETKVIEYYVHYKECKLSSEMGHYTTPHVCF